MQKILREASPSIRQTLLSNQIKTVPSLMTCDAAKITKQCDSEKQELQTIQQDVINQFSCFPLSGCDLLDEVMSSFYILPTGCDNWDELLDGGLYSGEVTEIVGSAGSGKTQVCLSIASFVAMNLEKNVVYIDTQGSFSSERIKEMPKARDTTLSDQDVNAILSRIKCFRTFDLFSLMGCLTDIAESIYNEDDVFYSSVQLVVVDCLASVLTPVLGGQQITGHSMMIHLSRRLKSLAVQNGLIVLITNNVVSDAKVNGGIKPALGQTWSHIPSTRIFLQKGLVPTNNKESCERIATVTKSSRQPVQISTTFYIETAGIVDVLLTPANTQSMEKST